MPDRVPQARAKERSPDNAPTAPVLTHVGRAGRGDRASDRVFAQLVDAIRSLRLLPGQPLSEVELARDLGVSRTPVREAIARLTDAGLVDVVPQVGTTVSVIRMSEVEEARFVRENLEVAAFKAALPITDDDGAQLRRLLDQQREAADAHAFDEFFRLDEALHERIFILSGHPGAWAAVQRMKVQLDRMRRLSIPDPGVIAELIEEHSSIVASLCSGDADLGESQVRAHARRALLLAPALRHDFPNYFA
jgi:DNA-binding GntR family transcriptional regulator